MIRNFIITALFTILLPTIGVTQSDFSIRMINSTYGTRAQDVLVNFEGLPIVLGYKDFNSLESHAFAQKYDMSGDTLWSKQYGGGNDVAWKGIITSDGGIAIVGWTFHEASGNGGDVSLAKLDANGELEWMRKFGNGEGYGIAEASEGGYVIVAKWEGTTGGVGADDMYVIRTDEFGNTIWQKTIGGISLEHGYSVQESKTESNVFYVLGWTMSFGSGAADLYLLKIDASGDVVWSKTYGNGIYEEGYPVLLVMGEAEGESIYMFGEQYDFSQTTRDIIAVKANSNGDVIWSNSYGSPGYDKVSDVVQMEDGFYLIGWTSGFTSLAKMLLAKIESNGDLVGGWIYGQDTNEEASQGYGLDYFENKLYIAGRNSEEAIFVKMSSNDISCLFSEVSLSQAHLNLDTASGIDIGTPDSFINTTRTTESWASGIITDCIGVTVENDNYKEDLLGVIYPNPTTGMFIVYLPDNYEDGTVAVWDLSGYRILHSTLTSQNLSVDLSNYPEGLYHVNVTVPDGMSWNGRVLVR